MYNTRSRYLVGLALVVFVCSAVVAQHHNKHDERALKEDPRLAPGQIAPVLEGLGDHHHPVTTVSERAQLFFDQGLSLTYGFNHQEALRAFKEAARLDPECAMAYWGWALVLSPNLNLPMSADVVPQAWEAIQTAVSLRDKGSPAERDYIDALATRLTDDPEAERAPLDLAYAEAMTALHAKYPDDTDAATLYAASLMNTMPWNYWNADGSPRQGTIELLAALEDVIEQDPHHEGALHYYIHAVESVDPARGEEAADLLRGLAPGAGHLTHMPSHIYMQRGRYAEAYDDNVLAAEADEGYIAQCRAQGLYPLGYYPHNVHFVAWAAIMQGRSADALAASRKVASQVPGDHGGNQWNLFQTFLTMPLYTMVRFGEWDAILEEAEPPENTLYVKGIWHYARGMAYVHTDRIKPAKKELARLRKLAADPALDGLNIGFTPATKLLKIATAILAGEAAAKRGKYVEALVQLDHAVRMEDGQFYTEPPDWYYPVRHTLGAVLLEAGYPEEAEVVYWQDLKAHIENGYALFGLWQALQAQGRDAAAVEIKNRFDAAWTASDVRLKSSRF